MPLTLEQFIRHAVATLNASPSPRLDAEVLVMHVTGLTRTALITCAGDALATQHEAPLRTLLARRARGEPVAYLTGRREFWSLELSVTPDVLIPRPETEILVEQALAHIPTDAPWTIADLGTGSGAVALALATERPHCRVIASDLSPAALDLARANAQNLGVANVEFQLGEWLAPFTGEHLDMIVSNPPYIAEQDPHLMQGDLRFEPRIALAAGADGLSAIRIIVADARRHLRRGGFLLIEHGFDQAQEVRALLAGQGYDDVATCPDLQGLPRVSFGTA